MRKVANAQLFVLVLILQFVPLYPSADLTSPIPVSQSRPHHYICNTHTWRDKVYYLDYMRYAFYLLNSSVNWWALVHYVSEDRVQTYYILTNFLISYTTVFLDLNQDLDTAWKKLKIATSIVAFLIGCFLDFITYKEHLLLLGGFAAIELVAYAITSPYKKSVKGKLGLVNSSAKLISVYIPIAGFLRYQHQWDYLSVDFYIVLINSIYTFSTIIDACGNWSVILLLVAGISQFTYAVLLAIHLWKKGIAVLSFSSGIENALHRRYTSFQDVCTRAITSCQDAIKRVQAVCAKACKVGKDAWTYAVQVGQDVCAKGKDVRAKATEAGKH